MSQTGQSNPSETAHWESQGSGYELSFRPFSATLGSGCFGGGLTKVRRDADPIAEQVYTAKSAKGSLTEAAESYVRGADHVSTHPASEVFPFRTQLAWTAVQLGAGVGAVLTVSLQTDLLDTRPELDFETKAEGSVHEADFGGWRIETPAGDTLLLSPHPTDTPETELVRTDQAVALRLTPPFLEKGVIRRFRLAAIALPREATEADIDSAIEAFGRLPLPLTS